MGLRANMGRKRHKNDQKGNCIAVWVCLLVGIGTSGSARADLSPYTYGALSVFPGLGQMLQGEVLEGLAWTGAISFTFFSGSAFVSHAGQMAWMYNIYDSYRDAGAKGEAQATALQNYIAPFNPLNVVDWVGAPLFAYTVFVNGRKGGNGAGMPNHLIFRPVYTSFTAFGEEALFRGYLYPAFTGLFHSKIASAAFTSVLFGVAHTQYNIPEQVIVAFSGMLFCLQRELNQGDLRHGIFNHAWIDFFGGLNNPGNRSPKFLEIPKINFQFIF